MNTIGIILTTFLRDDLLYKSVDSIIKNRPDNSVLLIGDQNPSEQKIKYFENYYWICYYPLEYDFGISASRNYLVEKANKFNCNYCLVTADNIQFTNKYDFNPVINFMLSSPSIGIVAFDIDYFWMYDLKIVNGEWNLIKVNKPLEFEGIIYKKYDLVHNFFLAKTQCLLHNKWDNNLKVTESLDFFWRLKNNPEVFVIKSGYEVYKTYESYFTNYIKALRVEKKEEEYKRYRARNTTNEFRNIVKEKYNLTGWIKGKK